MVPKDGKKLKENKECIYSMDGVIIETNEEFSIETPNGRALFNLYEKCNEN